MEEAIGHVKDGMTIMVGGFLGCGSPHRLIDALVEKGVKDLTLICNDSGFPDIGVGKLVVNKQIKKLIASHIGTNRETGNQMNAGEMEVVLVPQGTLAEQVRAGGSGLGGFLTPTGVGTVVEEGKEKIEIGGKTYASMTNVGTHPTINELKAPAIETNVLDFDNDVYGQPVTIIFLKKIRDELKFPSLDQMVVRMKEDEKFSRVICKPYLQAKQKRA